MREAHEMTGHFTSKRNEKLLDFGSNGFVLLHFIHKTNRQCRVVGELASICHFLKNVQLIMQNVLVVLYRICLFVSELFISSHESQPNK